MQSRDSLKVPPEVGVSEQESAPCSEYSGSWSRRSGAAIQPLLSTKALSGFGHITQNLSTSYPEPDSPSDLVPPREFTGTTSAPSST